MIKTRARALLPPVLLATAALAAQLPASASELEELRAQNAQLKAQLQALQQACPAAAPQAAAAKTSPQAASTAPVANPALATPAGSTATPTATAAATTAAPAVVATPSASPLPATQAVATPVAVPEGYQLVKIDPQVTAADAENCSHGWFFKGSKDALWKHEDSWASLAKRMKPAEVEHELGAIHTSVTRGERTLWEFGKCSTEANAQAYVVFEAGGLLFWQPPDF